jgi:hypothetical protein
MGKDEGGYCEDLGGLEMYCAVACLWVLVSIDDYMNWTNLKERMDVFADASLVATTATKHVVCLYDLSPSFRVANLFPCRVVSVECVALDCVCAASPWYSLSQAWSANSRNRTLPYELATAASRFVLLEANHNVS